MSDFRSQEAGSTNTRVFTLVARASGNPITTGTVNWYLLNISGANAGKWWRDSDQTWQAAETANAMTHQKDGHWTRTLAATPWVNGDMDLEYAKESGDLHIPISRNLKVEYTPSADSSRRVDLGASLGQAVTNDSNNALNVSSKWMGGTLLTARDIGASVLLSAGNGTGQLDFTTGVVKVNLVQILATALTEGSAGFLAAGFKKFFNIATPTLTMAGIDQTGNNFIRLGVPAGADISADIAANLLAVNNLNNLSALANLFGPGTLVRPSSGSIVYPFTFIVKDTTGHAIDVDTNTVTLTAKNAAGTDRSGNLSAVTHSGTGEYTFTYTVSSAHADEGLAVTAAGTVVTATRKAYFNTEVADADSLTALAAIQAKTDQLLFDGSSFVKSDPQTKVDLVNAPNATAITAIQSGLATAANLTTVLNRLGAITGSGVNNILGFFQSLLRSDVTVSSDIGGSYAPASASTQAIAVSGAAIKAKTDQLPTAPPFLEDAATGTPAADHFSGSNALSATDDFYKFAGVVFTSGILKGITNECTGYVGSTRRFNFATPFPAAPSAADTFLVIARLG